MELTEKHAEFVGLHFGDGSLIRRKGTNLLRFQIRGDAITDRQHYYKFIIPLCNELIGQPFFGRPVSTVFDRKGNCFGVSIESTKMESFFQELGIPVGEKQELSIPEWIKENAEFSKAFVRGLFDTDGGMHFRKNNTSKSALTKVIFSYITSTSKTLISETSEILKKETIKHYVVSFQPQKGNLVAHRIQVYKPHVTDFMTKIGSHNPKHLDKFEIWKRFGFCPTRTTPKLRHEILKGDISPYSLLPAGVE